ncbi:cation:proton antiporter [Spirochaeta cellobiosiphila]|uniref:cation:proton antiporter domain-containing protein n=1 Tax=Spirochaeta cellobiosiphila TaxID=504483 RepID=UPI0004174C02|nr:cation:proton antiporter [Spirochaeta cellobiosiphila]
MPDFLHFNTLLLLGLAIFGGTIGGRLFQKIKIPQVVGYIIIGLIIGTTGAKIISTDTLSTFSPFNSFALGLIGFIIGGELKKETIQKYGKQFTIILFLEALGAFFAAGLLVFSVSYLMFHDIKIATALGLLLGSISSATAAAGTTDVLWELKTRGPLTSTLLGIIALDDILALFLFAIVSSFASVLVGGGEQRPFYFELLKLVYEIGGAVILGLAAGYLLAKLLKNSHDEERTLTFTVGGILLVLGLATALDFDTILAAMFMGIMICNIAPKRSKDIFSLMEKLAPPVYVLFFVFVGAKLDLSTIPFTIIFLLLAYLLGRSGGKMFGAWFGGFLSKAPTTVRKYLSFCLFSQSGVAIGLSIIAGQKFSGSVGSTIITIVTASTFVVQLIGPVFIKYAVIKAGENGLNITENDLIVKSKALDVIDKAPILIRDNTPITKVLAKISESESLYFPVVNKDNQLTGVLSIEGIKNAFIAQELTDMILAHDLMEPVSYACGKDNPLPEVLEAMKHNLVESAPVLDEEKHPVGMIENRAVQKHFSRKILELQHKADALG